MHLRPYQERAVVAALEAVAAGACPVIVAPTGAGKTVIAAAIARRAHEAGKHVAMLVHTRDLVQQSRDTAASWGATVDVYTVQGMKPGSIPTADLWVLDEAHHYCAARWLEVARAIAASASVVGLTATPFRGDGKGLGRPELGGDGIFDRIIPTATVRELIAGGVLTPVDVYTPDAAESDDDARGARLAMKPGQAYYSVIRKHPAAEFPGLVFMPTMKDAEGFAVKAREYEPKDGKRLEWHAVGGATKTRAEDVARYKRGEIAAMVGCNLFKEGFDHRPTAWAIVTTQVGPVAAVQIPGRVMRSAPGKQRAIIVSLQPWAWPHPHEPIPFDLASAPKPPPTAPPTCPVCGRVTDGEPCHPREVAARRMAQIKAAALRKLEEQRAVEAEIEAVRGDPTPEGIQSLAAALGVSIKDAAKRVGIYRPTPRDLAALQRYAELLGYAPGWAWMQHQRSW